MKIDLTINANKHKKSTNKDNYQPLSFNRKVMVLPISETEKTINAYKVFEDERNNCESYRLNLTLNPIMTNVLTNKVTEVLYNGNKLTGQNRLNAIQTINDELYEYRLGYDIFDNNYMRVDTFKTGSTLNDFTGTTLYGLKSIESSAMDNLLDDNGWVGLQNKVKINGNKMFKTKQPCEKIDLFPTREYFLFNPIYTNNSLRDNWDYLITYPYKNEKNNILVKSNNGINGIPVDSYEIVNFNDSDYLQVRTIYKHGLKKDDIIKIKSNDRNSDLTYLIYDIGTFNGLNNEYVFLIDVNKYSELKNYYNYTNCRIVKVINNVDSEYHIRVLKKISQNDITNEAYQPGFARNIYNDSLYQIQYLDDININSLRDNLNRPLSELYLTIIKRNVNSSDNEPDTIFTKVISGIDCKSNNSEYPNIRVLNNISLPDPLETNITKTGSTLNNVKLTDMFLSDIVEYNITTLKENVIENIQHRFNTIQREENNVFSYNDIFSDNSNMLQNSGFLDGMDNWNFTGLTQSPSIINSNTTGSGKAISIITNSIGYSGMYNNNNQQLKFIPGQNYILSFSIKGNSNFTLNKVGIDGVTTTSINVTNSWVNYNMTFSTNDYNFKNLIFYGYNSSNRFYVTNIKIEKGTSQTAWTSNPDDNDGKYIFGIKNLNLEPYKEGYFYKPNYKILLKNYSDSIVTVDFPDVKHCDGFISGVTFNNEIVLLENSLSNEIKQLILKIEDIDKYLTNDRIRITNKSSLNYKTLNVIKSEINKFIYIPYNYDLMGDVTTLNINDFYIKRYLNEDVPDYCQDQFNGKCSWKIFLKQGETDTDESKRIEFIYTNGCLYITKSFNFFLKRQDPFGLYGIRKNTFPSDLNSKSIEDEILNNKIANKTSEVC